MSLIMPSRSTSVPPHLSTNSQSFRFASSLMCDVTFSGCRFFIGYSFHHSPPENCYYTIQLPMQEEKGFGMKESNHNAEIAEQPLL
jgi:hypothetical protein